MSNFGTMVVDWEQRIDMRRMRQERLAKAKEALNRSSADVLFVFRTEDSRYLTGYRHHLGPAANLGQSVTVLAEDSEPVLFTMDWEYCQARMPWLEAEQIQPRANFREEVGIKQWADRLTGLMGDLDGKVIGVDLWTPTLEQNLRSTFPNSEFVDGYNVLLEAKIVKTKDEIECLKMANTITEAAMDAAVRFLRPGVRECEVLAVAWQTMTALGSEWTQCSNIVASGPYTAPYRRFTSDRIINIGDMVVIDIGACFNGYWGDLTRTWICGELDGAQEQKQVYQNAYEALWNACDAARQGNTTADVFAAAEPYVLDSLGHGSGMSPWEPPYFSPQSADDPMELREGMQFNLEPYAGEIGVGGARLENNLVVTAEEPDVYTTYPFDHRLLLDVHRLDTTTGRSL
jgi:Xaa-Pro aminopeptidase